jgi:hypothetical protein
LIAPDLALIGTAPERGFDSRKQKEANRKDRKGRKEEKS